jgi:hypothetical protein
MISIQRAILSGRPIVVSSHRWNYVESVNPDSERALKMLRKLAERIKTKTPNILFLGSSDLVKELYIEHEEIRHNAKLQVKTLSGKEKFVHGLRCTWFGHSRIRLSMIISGLLLLWSILNWKLQKYFNKNYKTTMN